MAVERIRFDQGLVQTKDESELAPGECSRLDDSFYKPNDRGVWKKDGRLQTNATAEATAILGAVFLEFDGTAEDLYVALVGSVYRTAPAVLNGVVFSDGETGLDGSATSMDAAHYNNRWYLFNGVDRNRRVDNEGTFTKHGMLGQGDLYAPRDGLRESIFLSETGGGGAGFTLTTDVTVSYWFEERVKDSDGNILKRSPATSDDVVTITGDGVTTYKPRISRGGVANQEATHIALIATSAGGEFPIGADISEKELSDPLSGAIDDTRTGLDPAIPDGATYEINTVVVQGITVPAARNGTPPIASTGDVFEDSLVMNDITDKSLIRYTWADEPAKCPDNNVFRMETKKQDEVTLIRTVGKVVCVGMRDSLWRINTLPRSHDSAFEIERVKDDADAAYGPVGEDAGVTFSWGQGPRLAYMSRFGMMVTDGFRWAPLTDDLNIEEAFAVQFLDKCVVRNNPRMYRLEVYATPKGGTTNTVCYYLHYHPSHAKRSAEGQFRAKVSGPIPCHANDAMLANVGGFYRMLTAAFDGFLYLEDEGNTDQSEAGGVNQVVRSGDYYLNSQGGDANVTRSWVHHSARDAGGVNDTTFAMTSLNENEAPHEQTDDEISLEFREMTTSALTDQAEAFQFGVDNSDEKGTYRTDYVVVEYTPGGRTEKGN